MYHYKIEIRAANPYTPFNFEKDKGRKKQIEKAINICNSSSNFKTYKKRITIKETNKESFVIELSSRTPLEKPMLSLRGVSRWLVATKEYEEYIFRGSLFNGVVRDTIQDKGEELGEVEAMQEIVRVFFGTDREDKIIKEKIIKMVSDHRNNRM